MSGAGGDDSGASGTPLESCSAAAEEGRELCGSFVGGIEVLYLYEFEVRMYASLTVP